MLTTHEVTTGSGWVVNKHEHFCEPASLHSSAAQCRTMVVKQITVDTAWHCRPVCHRLYTSSPKHQSNYSISRKWRHFRLCNNAFSYYDNKATCQVNSIKDRRHDHTNCLRKHKRLCASVSHLDYYPTTCSRPADSVVNRPQWTFYSLPSQRSTARSLAITSHTELLQQSTTISATTTGSKTDRQTDNVTDVGLLFSVFV